MYCLLNITRSDRDTLSLDRMLLPKPPDPCRPERAQAYAYDPFRGEGHSVHTFLTKHSNFPKLPSDKMPIHTLCGVALITGAATGQL